MATKLVPSSEQPVSVYQIDAVNRRVTEVPYDGSLNQLYALLNCQCIDYTARQANGDGIFCNDLLTDDPQQVAYRLRSTSQLVYGNGVWTGSDDEGNTVTPCTSLTDVSAEIEFLGEIPYQPAPIYILSW